MRKGTFMTDEKIIGFLKNISDEISEEEYPEIYDILDAKVDFDDGVLYCSEEYLTDLLHEADGAKRLPKSVADFLIKSYSERMENGDADAACDIGALYYTGRCGEQSFKKALEYYTISANGGCRQAQENLGYCYYYGRDTEVDYEKAFHFFALGAFDGHLRSLYKIGDMYRNGYYVKKNEKEAYQIYKRCEETMTDSAVGFVGADVMMRLGDCYFGGIGTDVDYKSALKYYQEAERMFYERLEEGDYLIRGCYNHVISRQAETRDKLKELLPSFDWTEN